MSIQVSDRVANLPTYIFSKINDIKKKAQTNGMDLLSLAIGDPDLPTPEAIVTKMQEAVTKPENHQYSPYNGTDALRTSFANWFEKRFGPKLDPNTEVLALIGSKEGLAHFPVAFCNPGDVCLYPSPGFPMYRSAILMADGRPEAVSLRYENDFLPDLNELEAQFKSLSPKFMYLNYPHNPTSAICPKNILEDIVTLAKKYNVILAYDNAYSEVYYNESKRPVSILEIEGAKDIAIEFHSMSKAYNMTGWRLAYAVGNKTLLNGLLKVKTNVDSGPLPSVQETSIYALENYEKFNTEIRNVYKERLAVLSKGLTDLNIEHIVPEATFFLWAKVPNKMSSMEFVTALIEQTGLVLTPGSGFGPEGEGFFRMAMTVDVDKMKNALERLRAFLKD